MTRDDIICMAREAGFNSHHNPDLYDCMVASNKAIERFAALVAAAEREACAKVCDDMACQYDISIDPVEELIACETAAAIRARGQA